MRVGQNSAQQQIGPPKDSSEASNLRTSTDDVDEFYLQIGKAEIIAADP